jgi:hypothetical protein
MAAKHDFTIERIELLPGGDERYRLTFRSEQDQTREFVGWIEQDGDIRLVHFEPDHPADALPNELDPRPLQMLVSAFERARRDDATEWQR